MEERVRLVHGNGGAYSKEFVEKYISPYFHNEYLAPLHDGAMLPATCGRIAMTTDSYVVKPLVFPGGNIGKMSICGTINDLVMTGAVPKYMSCGLILEEGLSISLLQEVLVSMAQTAKETGVSIVTGDTKVVGKGQADALFINTAGIGYTPHGRDVGPHRILAGQDIILTGTLGDHAVAVMGTRYGITLPDSVVTDCAPLSDMLLPVLERYEGHILCMRDPTRGGLATALCELAMQSGVGILIEEECVPITEEVSSVCSILGYDPLHLANEGKAILFVEPEYTDTIVKDLREHSLGQGAICIGKTLSSNAGRVAMKTSLGGIRVLEPLKDDLLPRIC